MDHNNFEIKFFKVWRNKYLLNIIFQCIKVGGILPIDRIGFFKLKYDQIKNVGYMLKNNYISLLKDKVVNNKFLDFCECYDNLSIIFKNDQLKNDIQFFKSLFENYKQFFLPSIKQLMVLSVESDCVVAFNLLTTYYINRCNDDGGGGNEKNENIFIFSLFKKSIKSNSFNISRLFINNENETKDGYDSNIGIGCSGNSSNSRNNSNYYKRFLENKFDSDIKVQEFWKDVLISFISDQEISSDSIQDALAINYRVDFILDELKLSEPKQEISELLSLYSIKIEDMNLHQLIHSNAIVYKLRNAFLKENNTTDYTKSFFKKLIQNNHSSKEYQIIFLFENYSEIWEQFKILDIIELKEINSYFESVLFNYKQQKQQQLLSTLVKHFNNGEYNGLIEKLIKSLIPFTRNKEKKFLSIGTDRNINYFLYNFVFYSTKYKMLYTSNNDTGLPLFNNNILSLLNGNYETLEVCFRCGSGNTSSYLYKNIHLFGNVKYDKKLQIQFITNAIDDIIKFNGPKNQNDFLTIHKSKISVLHLLEHLILFKDLELIQEMFDRLCLTKEQLILYSNNNKDIILSLLITSTSIPIFDYLFNLFGKPEFKLDQFFNKANDENVEHILSIIKHFRANYQTQYINSIKKFTFARFYYYPTEIIKFLYEHLYTGNDNFIDFYKSIDVWKVSAFDQRCLFSFKDYKYLVNLTPSNQNYTLYNYNNNNISTLNVFLIFNWLITNKMDDIISGRCKIEGFDIVDEEYRNLLIYDYYLGTFESKLPKKNKAFLFKDSMNPLGALIGKLDDLKNFKLILHSHFSNLEINGGMEKQFFLRFLKNVITDAVDNSSFEIIKFLLDSNSQPIYPYYTIIKDSIVKGCFQNGNYKLAELLIDNYNLDLDLDFIDNIFLLNFLKDKYKNKTS